MASQHFLGFEDDTYSMSVAPQSVCMCVCVFVQSDLTRLGSLFNSTLRHNTRKKKKKPSARIIPHNEGKTRSRVNNRKLTRERIARIDTAFRWHALARSLALSLSFFLSNSLARCMCVAAIPYLPPAWRRGFDARVLPPQPTSALLAQPSAVRGAWSVFTKTRY